MYNSQIPANIELPSKQKLLKSTVIAFVTAFFITVTIVLPSEYGVDPTGVGSILGLKEMGEIKEQLASEAEEDRLKDNSNSENLSTPSQTLTPADVPVTNQTSTLQNGDWKDQTVIELDPGKGIEIKLTMQEGETANYAWKVNGGLVNYDTHGEGSGNTISYKKDRGVTSDQGQIVAAFTGKHGWFFRNRGDDPIKVILSTGGTYSEIK